MIDREQVLKIANLAKLNLSEEETDKFTGQLGAILDFVKQLDNVDTGTVEPTCFVVPSHDPLRDDAEKPSLPQEETLRNGPKVKKGFFAVPKVIDGK
jgi:aspartyl-tRNA(Asn)/glutamyl-tRNA(Gln) amidotransferase subunit C